MVYITFKFVLYENEITEIHFVDTNTNSEYTSEKHFQYEKNPKC